MTAGDKKILINNVIHNVADRITACDPLKANRYEEFILKGMYVCVYVYVCMYVCMCVCIYLFIDVCMYITQYRYL